MNATTTTTTTYGRGYAWALVALFTAASVALNGAHAVLGMADASAWARFWAVLTAVLFPLAVLAETHFLVNLIREWDTRARWIAALRMVCIVAVLVVAYIAFVRSFYALGDMAALMGIPDEDWWMLPASVDAMIILATLGVVIAEGQMALDRDEAEMNLDRAVTELVELDDRPTESPDRPDDINSTDRPSQPTTLSELADRAPNESLDRLDRANSTGPDQLVQPSEPLAQSSNELVDHEPNELVDQASNGPNDRPTEPVDRDVTEPHELADRVPYELAEWVAVAERVRETTSIMADVDELARVLAMDAAGETRGDIAAAVGRAKSTVSGWIKVAKATTDGEPSHSKLAAVR